MMKQKVIFACIIALGVPLVLAGCCSRAEMARLKADLETAERQRDYLQERLRATEQAPEQAPGPLQTQVDEFIKIRDALLQREVELTRLRDAALAEAQTAQELMNKLGAQLQAETEKVNELQDQLQQAQAAIEELQNKLQ